MIVTRASLILSVLVFVLLELVTGCNLSSHPSDPVLEETLKSNQTDFDTLVKMLTEDEDIVRLDDRFVFLTEGSNRNIPEERLEAYRKLFAKLGLKGGFHRDKPNALRFIASTQATTLSSSEKSYVFSTTMLSPVVDSLDTVARGRRDQRPVYKKLHGSWYLYYESW
jgi:hypothetical protein